MRLPCTWTELREELEEKYQLEIAQIAVANHEHVVWSELMPEDEECEGSDVQTWLRERYPDSDSLLLEMEAEVEDAVVDDPLLPPLRIPLR